MSWRDTYKVHPAADEFPMMSAEELKALGEDIKANGVRVPVAFWGKYDGNGRFHGELIDGRNRLEAADRAGLDPDDAPRSYLTCGDPVSWIIALNVHRRHLTKQQQADLIVAAIKAGEKLPQPEEVSKGGRGKVNKAKAKAVAEAKKLDISKATVERAIAKAEGREPKTSAELGKPKRRTSAEVGADHIADQIAAFESSWSLQPEAMREKKLQHILKESDPVALASRLLTMMDADQLRRFCVMVDQHKLHLGRKRASQKPAGGRSDERRDDPTPENEGDDLGDIPACLDRRSAQKERAASS